MTSFEIAGTKIGANEPPIVVAEIGINHEGKLDVAIEMADAAIDAGAKFIKHQTHIPDAEMSLEARDVIPGNAEESIYDVISRCTLSAEEEFSLMQHVQKRGAIFFSTPFSREAADRLEDWNVPLYKIGSGECNNYPLVDHIAKFRKPVILSTGMNSIESIRTSVEIFRSARVPFALLHTTNLYPTPSRLLRLGGVTELKKAFPDAVVGLSDHSLNNLACISSIALGARIVERHFTDSKSRPGPDIICSMDGKELSGLLDGVQQIYQASGGSRVAAEEEKVTIAFAFSSVVATRKISRGESLGPDNIWLKRPNGGDFGPLDLTKLYGRIAISDIEENRQVQKNQLSSSET